MAWHSDTAHLWRWRSPSWPAGLPHSAGGATVRCGRSWSGSSIAVSLTLFAVVLISLGKAGMLARWARVKGPDQTE